MQIVQSCRMGHILTINGWGADSWKFWAPGRRHLGTISGQSCSSDSRISALATVQAVAVESAERLTVFVARCLGGKWE